MRLAALVIASFALSAGPSPHWRSFDSNGVSYHYPPRWAATAAPLTAVTSPQQIIALASFAFPTNVAGADGCEPKEALDRIPPNGVFIFGWEYGQLSPQLGIRPHDFPPRPKHFTLTNLAQYECMGRSYMLRFSDRGWAFQIHVSFGSRASAATRATALRILDSFNVN
jgi:hypothetical protein